MKNRPTFLIIYLLSAAAVSCIVRYVQLIGDVIDFNTGFFYPHTGFMRYLHYIVLGVALAGIIVLAIIEKHRKTRFFTKKMGHFDDGDTAICGIMLLMTGFAVIYTAVMSGLGGIAPLQLVAVLLGVAGYGFAGVVLLRYRRVYPSVGMVFLLLSGFYVLRMMELFLSNYIILSMSEHLIRLVQMALFALFYLSAGRIFLRAEMKSTRVKACIFGFFTAVVSVSEITAKMIFWLGSMPVRRPAAESRFIAPDMLMAAETVALLTILICMTRYKTKKAKTTVGEAAVIESETNGE
ncbi:MAG: hypothetical protein FWH20_06105 [Oscillospiraceae bacterium]|nr:hypothetical protein [Oscillospiraceae bacterium]